MKLFKRVVLRITKSSRIQQVLSKIGYYCGVDDVFYFLTRNRKRIVNFHNVLPDNLFRNDMANGVSCSRSQFNTIVGEIIKRFGVTTDLCDCSKVTLTFDDGYLNQYEIAADALTKFGLSGILFGSGDALTARAPAQALVVDQLLFWTAYAPCDALSKFSVAFNGNRRDFWCSILRPEYALDSMNKGRNVWTRLNKIFPFADLYGSLDPEYVRLRMTGIPEDKMDDLRKLGWKIGWHTRSHYPLSSLSKEESIAEITPPPQCRDVAFSFPYGEIQSVSARDIEIAKSCGYPCAVSNTENYVSVEGQFFIPRMSLSDNKIMLHFKLSGFKYFLDNLRLLPNLKLEY